MSDLFESTAPVIKEYSAQDIEVLEGLEPVRHRPGMYIGGVDEQALHHLVAEILDNSMDEAVAGFANHIEVRVNADGSVTITDNGRGIPVDPHPKYPGKSALEVIMTILHSGGKFGGRDVRKVVRKDIEDKVANIIVEADGNISQIDVDADGDEIKVTGK